MQTQVNLQTNVSRLDSKCTAGRKDDIYQSSMHPVSKTILGLSRQASIIS